MQSYLNCMIYVVETIVYCIIVFSIIYCSLSHCFEYHFFIPITLADAINDKLNITYNMKRTFKLTFRHSGKSN